MLKIGVITMALLSFLNANWFTDFFDSTPAPAIYIPIDLTKPSKIETKVRIKEKRSFFATLSFRYKDYHDATVLQKFIGYNVYDPYSGKSVAKYKYRFVKKDLTGGGVYIDESYNPDGTTVPIKMTIYKLGENGTRTLFLEKTYQTKGHNGGGSGNVGMFRDFAYLLLEKGRYLFIVENLKGFPELQGREVVFVIHLVHTK